MSQDTIDKLFSVIESRKNADITASYVASLFDEGTVKIAEKVEEEAAETCVEALKKDNEKLAEESADLLFHLMVLWADAGITPEDVIKVLEKREGISGIAEKESRNK